MNELIEILTNNIFLALKTQLNRQKHRLTGALEDSFSYKVKETANKTAIQFLMNNYGVFLNDGIPPPFYKKSGGSRGGKSKHIQGLIRWAKLKFRYSEKRAQRVAFAVAAKHKKFGYPLTAKGFINLALLDQQNEIEKFVEDYTEEMIKEFINSFLDGNK